MTVFLVRHARAGRRSEWADDDRLRPLSKRGRRQAAALVPLLVPELAPELAPEPHRGPRMPPPVVLSSPWVRCRQTVTPLAEALGVEVGDCIELGEGAGPKMADLLGRLGDRTAVLCTHGDVIACTLEMVQMSGLKLDPSAEFAKGSTWVLDEGEGHFRSARYIPPPA